MRYTRIFGREGFLRSALLMAAALGLAASAGSRADSPGSVRAVPNYQQDLIKQVRLDQKLDGQVPLNLTFLDDAGKTVKLADYFGEKPVVLTMIQYRCTMLCNEELNTLTRSLKELKFDAGNQFNLLTVSIDPRETPAVAAEKKQSYVKEYGRPGAAQGWRFLTGTKGQIDALANAVGFHYAFDPKTNQYAHPDGVIVITPKGKIARYFFRLEYPSQGLRFAVIEASHNKIGSPVDYLALLCFHYNPVTGTYSLAIMELMRMAGIATVLLLALGVFLMKRWDSKETRSVESAA